MSDLPPLADLVRSGDEPFTDDDLDRYFADRQHPASGRITNRVDGWRVTDLASANWAMGRLRAAKQEEARVHVYATECRQRIDAWERDATGRPMRDAVFFESRLIDYARQTLDARHKSMPLIGGRLASTSHAAKVALATADDDSELVALASRIAPEAVRSKVLVSTLRSHVEVGEVGWRYMAMLACGDGVEGWEEREVGDIVDCRVCAEPVTVTEVHKAPRLAVRLTNPDVGAFDVLLACGHRVRSEVGEWALIGPPRVGQSIICGQCESSTGRSSTTTVVEVLPEPADGWLPERLLRVEEAHTDYRVTLDTLSTGGA